MAPSLDTRVWAFLHNKIYDYPAFLLLKDVELPNKKGLKEYLGSLNGLISGDGLIKLSTELVVDSYNQASAWYAPGFLINSYIDEPLRKHSQHIEHFLSLNMVPITNEQQFAEKLKDTIHKEILDGPILWLRLVRPKSKSYKGIALDIGLIWGYAPDGIYTLRQRNGLEISFISFQDLVEQVKDNHKILADYQNNIKFQEALIYLRNILINRINKNCKNKCKVPTNNNFSFLYKFEYYKKEKDSIKFGNICDVFNAEGEILCRQRQFSSENVIRKKFSFEDGYGLVINYIKDFSVNWFSNFHLDDHQIKEKTLCLICHDHRKKITTFWQALKLYLFYQFPLDKEIHRLIKTYFSCQGFSYKGSNLNSNHELTRFDVIKNSLSQKMVAYQPAIKGLEEDIKALGEILYSVLMQIDQEHKRQKELAVQKEQTYQRQQTLKAEQAIKLAQKQNTKPLFVQEWERYLGQKRQLVLNAVIKTYEAIKNAAKEQSVAQGVMEIELRLKDYINAYNHIKKDEIKKYGDGLKAKIFEMIDSYKNPFNNIGISGDQYLDVLNKNPLSSFLLAKFNREYFQDKKNDPLYSEKKKQWLALLNKSTLNLERKKSQLLHVEKELDHLKKKPITQTKIDEIHKKYVSLQNEIEMMIQRLDLVKYVC